MKMTRKALAMLLAVLMIAALSASVPASAITVETLVNIAEGCEYTATKPYTDRTYPSDYQLIDGKELTDGVKASSPYGTEWHGFYKTYAEDGYFYITVDLGEKVTDIKRLSIQCQDNSGAGISLPGEVEFFAGENADSLESVGKGVKDGNATYPDYALDIPDGLDASVIRVKIKPGESIFFFVSEFEALVEGTVEIEPTQKDMLNFLYNAPLNITEDGFVYGIEPGTTVETLAEYINLSDNIVVKDKDGNVKTSGKLEMYDKIEKYFYGELIDSVTVILQGDFDFNGNISQLDYLQVKRALLSDTQLTDMQKDAVCIANGESITQIDCLRIKRQVVGVAKISDMYKDPIKQYDMTLTRTNNTLYTLSSTYLGKTLNLTFFNTSWGTWNIGSWSYAGATMAGGGTDWEYVNMIGEVGGTQDWSGGNHGKETLKSITFTDGTTGKVIELSNGQSASIKNLTIVEETELYLGDPNKPYANVVRKYSVAGNNITLEVEFEFIRDMEMGRSYTCMFPVDKDYGLYADFYTIDGEKIHVESTPDGVKPDFSGPHLGTSDSMRVVLYGDKQPSYKFEVEVFSLEDNCDYFSNSDKTFLWDMNSTHNKLYFSKFSSGEPTLMKAGTRTSTKASWTFTAE